LRAPDLSASVLFGGDGEGAGDFFTGNTLNLWTDSGIEVNSVENFEFLNFVIPAGLSGAMLTGSVTFGDGIKDSIITVSTLGGPAPFQPGNEVTLIDGSTNDDFDAQVMGQHGATLQYNWTLAGGGNNPLAVTVNSVRARPQAKALSEGFLAGVALATQGADLAAGAGMNNAVSAAQGTGSGFGAFGALSGGSLRYKSGSHVDMDSVSLVVGLAVGRNFTPGRATAGAFFEYGTGSYDARNSFATGRTKGKGDTRYYGGGIMGRMDFANNAYTEASARMGRLRNEYRTSDLRDAIGQSARGYDSSTPYYGFHLGTGYIWNINDKASLDIYGKYFWTQVAGDSVTLSTKDPVKFKDADSSRLRLGGRFAYAVNEFVSPYIGAAWEHEFDGKAKATTYGYSIDAPSIRGSTGIGELGLSLTPSKNLPLSIDLGVQGYTGKREGVTGSLQLRFEF